MDKKTLVTLDSVDIEEGKKLLEALDCSNLSVSAAFWYYLDGPETYRLMIVTPFYDKYGPRKTYEKIQRATLNSKVSINLRWDAVSVLGLKNELYKSLHTTVQTGIDMAGKRLTGSVIDGTYIDDAYFYRLS